MFDTVHYNLSSDYNVQKLSYLGYNDWVINTYFLNNYATFKHSLLNDNLSTAYKYMTIISEDINYHNINIYSNC